MASVSSLLSLALLASLCVGTSNGDIVAFLDASSGSYLRASAPQRLSADGYAALEAILTRSSPNFRVSKSAAEEVRQFLVPKVFDCPAATWNVALFGVTQKELFANDAAQTSAVKFVELYGGASASSGSSPLRSSFRSCGYACLASTLGQAATSMGGALHSEKSFLTGRLSLPQCSAEPLQLEAGSLTVWAAEIAGLWRTVADGAKNRGPVHYDSTLTGLHLVRLGYGVDSDAFRFASCFSRSLILRLHAQLENEFDGNVMTAILMEDLESEIEADEGLNAAMIAHGRSLLETLKWSDNDASTTTLEKVQRFSTNAVGYVMFLILLACSLSAFYAMVNMDFTKDTLLYSQVKIE